MGCEIIFTQHYFFRHFFFYVIINQMKYLEGLNEAQKTAVLYIDGPLLIIAGAGAGKTKTITCRIAHLIKSGVFPEKILAVTFTNKAAKEMHERVSFLLGKNATFTPFFGALGVPLVSTFHSLGVGILREHGHALGIKKQFRIFDGSDSISAIKKALKQAELDPKQFEPRRMQNAISRYKEMGMTYARFAEQIGNEYFPRMVEKAWREYDAILKREHALDFDDLLLQTLILLREHKAIRKGYQERWHYVHIDEYQDTNAIQYEISRLLAGERKNICVVGDGDQSVYSWRGADFRNILNFEKEYSDAKVVLLEKNYRSTKTILDAANGVIKKNMLRKGKNLFTDNKDGEKIALYAGYNESDEARFVANKASALIDSGVKSSEIAVLYRANFQSRAIEEAMIDRGVPYQVLGVRFFERKEVKDIFSFLRLAINPESVADLARVINVPARGIGKATLSKVVVGKENELPAAARAKVSAFQTLMEDIRKKIMQLKTSELILYVMQKSGLEQVLKKGAEDDQERLMNIMELMTFSNKYDTLPPEEGVQMLLSDAALASDQDFLDDKTQKKDGVKLMTAHASKGLEFEYVFITGLEQDLFPHVNLGNPESNDERYEEERRLFYVALTRAKEKLFLSYASVRTVFGSKQMNIPSDFLNDIDSAHLEMVDMSEEEEVFNKPLNTSYFD